MPNSRITLSIIALLSGVNLIWLMISLGAIEPIEFATMSTIELVYFLLVCVFYVYYWIYFYGRPRGSKTIVDGRAAVSVSALIVGGTVGYVLVDFGIIVPWESSEFASGNFILFIACTILPLVAWFLIFLNVRQQAASGRKRASETS